MIFLKVKQSIECEDTELSVLWTNIF